MARVLRVVGYNNGEVLMCQDDEDAERRSGSMEVAESAEETNPPDDTKDGADKRRDDNLRDAFGY